MILSTVVMTSLHIPAVGRLFQHINMLLIFETVCLLAFGVAWLTKGEAILKDEEAPQGGSPSIPSESDAPKREATV